MTILVWSYAKKTIARENVQEVEGFLGVRFPESYVSCVLENNGGRPSPFLFECDNRKDAVFESLLRVESNHKYGIVMTSQRLAGVLPGGCVPFAADPFGNLLCFKYPCHGTPPVVFWDHEQSGAASITPVCGSFDALLEMLHE